MPTVIWSEIFGLDGADRSSRLFLTPEDTYDAPFGHAMAQGLESGVSGYLAYQGKPLVAFVHAEDEQSTPGIDALRKVWDNLWNQGLASLLVLHCPGTVKVYSLTSPTDDQTKRLTHVEVIELAALGLDTFTSHCRDLILKIEDGQYYEDHNKRFCTADRVDQKLLSNMEGTSRLLSSSGLSHHQARTLLLQTLFIAYLEDRGILHKRDFLSASGHASLFEIFKRRDVDAFYKLFDDLSEKFNGDVFSSPCSFSGIDKVKITPEHLSLLKPFRSGEIDILRGQFNILPLYNFKFIPVEILSAIYDRFQNKKTQKETGSYFTPAYLAQACLNMAWKYLSRELVFSPDFRVLDPACGSAVFLVCVFQRLVGLEQTTSGALNWKKLQTLLRKLHGIDTNEDALRVGIISLYFALLERSDPPSLSKLLEKGHLLPRLLGETMRVGDFFDEPSEDSQTYDLIVGNPPWVSRNENATAKITTWCKAQGCDAPGGSTVWGFLWKAGRMLQKGGVAALLVDARILFNLQAENARRRLFSEFRIPLVVNLADARFQLFEGAKAPAALCVLQPMRYDEDNHLNETEYWVPKANPVFSANHRIALSQDDCIRIKQWRFAHDTSFFNTYRWGRSRDINLLKELRRFDPLSNIIAEYKHWSNKNRPSMNWWIGQGHQPQGKNEFLPGTISGLTDFPFVDASSDNYLWILPKLFPGGNTSDKVRRFGITRAIINSTFSPPMILLKQGVKRKTGLLQATYTEQRVTFVDSIQAIVSLTGKHDPMVFKILTAVLNSRLAAWFFFHTSAMQGVERDKVLQNEIISLPFPLPNNSDDYNAGRQIIDIMNSFADDLHMVNENSNDSLRSNIIVDKHLNDHINNLVYRYYGLTKTERQVVEDTFHYVLPSIQPRKNEHPPLWGRPDPQLLKKYAQSLRDGMAANYIPGTKISVTIFGGTNGLVVVEMIHGSDSDEVRVETADAELTCRLVTLQRKWPQDMSRGVHHLLQMTFALENRLYLVKPNRIRHWMPSTALCDVDRIVADLNIANLRTYPS